MELTAANLDIIFRDVQQTYQSVLQKTPVIHPEIATTMPMKNRSVTLAFLDRLPQMRKWLGTRVINNAIAHSRTVLAQLFEHTLGLDVDTVEDDEIGLFMLAVTMQTEAGAKWPDGLIAYYLLNEAASVNGFDGVPNYSESHPLLGGVDGPIPDGAPATQSNLLLNTPLTWDNYVLARQTMRSWVGADGAPMMAEPNVLMVPPYLEGIARQILESDFRVLEGVTTAPQSNTMKGTCKVLVNPWLSSFSNDEGDGNWWLLDTTKAVKPFVFHQRKPVTLTALTNPGDPNVFLNNPFVWGLKSRGTATESVWWLSLAATSEAQYDFNA